MPLMSLSRLALNEDPRRRAFAMATGLVLLALVVSQLFVPQLTRSATSETLTAKADAFVDSGHRDTNYGTADSLATDRMPYGRKSYLRFDTPGLRLRDLKRATLRLFSTRSNDLGAAIYALSDDDWSESGITFNNSTRPRQMIAHSDPLTAGKWIEIDLTDALRNGATGGDDRVTLVVKRSPFSDRVVEGIGDQESETGFTSRETGSTAPQLVVSTDASAPTTTTQKPTTTTAKPATTTTTAPPTHPSGCVGVTGNLQAAVNANPAGTNFCLSGTFNEKVTPKSGQSFTGPAVLDGRGSIDRAFAGSGANVTLQNLEVRNYNPGRQHGAIEPEGDGWTLRNVNVNHNGWGGIYILGDNTKVLGGKVTDHAGLGIGDSKVSGTVIDGTEIARNGFAESCGFEAGGVKFVGVNTIVRNTFTHHNQCKGLWWDINAANTLIEGNRVEDNWDEGIFYEISQDAVIRNNVVRRNGLHTLNAPGRNGCPWLFGGGITIASSFNVQIYGNTLEGNCNGITGTQQDRSESTPPAHLLKNVNVHDNTVNGSGKSGAVEDNGADLRNRAIVFTNNTLGSGSDFCGFSC